MQSENIEDLNIYQKLAKIRKLVNVIRKNKSGYGYKYVTEEEILSRIKSKMDEYELSLVPCILSGSTKVTPYHYIKTEIDKRHESFEKHCNEMIVQADMQWMWVNNRNPDERIVVPWTLVGQQSDISQAFGAALTYSSRYFLLKYFNIATSEDDPETFRKKQKEVEHETDLMIAKDIAEEIHSIVTNIIKDNPQKKGDIMAIIKKYLKTANYYEVKDSKTATAILEEINKLIKKGEK